MTLILGSILTLLLSGVGQPAICLPPGAGQRIVADSYCCTTPSGQQCCATAVDDRGMPAGCGC